MSLFHPRSRAEQFEAMAAEYERPIYLLCLRMMGNREDAQDCAQEALLRAFRAFDRFRDGASPKTWLYRIAYNTCIDELRRRRGVVSLDTLREGGFDVPDATAERAYASWLSRPWSSCPRISAPRWCCASSSSYPTRRSPTPCSSLRARSRAASTEPVKK